MAGLQGPRVRRHVLRGGDGIGLDFLAYRSHRVGQNKELNEIFVRRTPHIAPPSDSRYAQQSFLQIDPAIDLSYFSINVKRGQIINDQSLCILVNFRKAAECPNNSERPNLKFDFIS